MSSFPTSAALRSPTLTQRWSAYQDAEHGVWETLYRRRMEALVDEASVVFLAGLEAVGLEPTRIPRLRDVNRLLAARTGWRAVPVAGFLESRAFFGSLARKRFPTTITIRSADSLEYTPEPDIFHDVFGHVPLHADPRFAAFLQRFGRIAERAADPAVLERLARIFWFTVEFGLIEERGRPRVYGSGLISSSAEAKHALGPSCERRPFRLEEVAETPFVIDQIQPVFFVIEDFGALFDCLGSLERTTVV